MRDKTLFGVFIGVLALFIITGIVYGLVVFVHNGENVADTLANVPGVSSSRYISIECPMCNKNVLDIPKCVTRLNQLLVDEETKTTVLSYFEQNSMDVQKISQVKKISQNGKISCHYYQHMQ